MARNRFVSPSDIEQRRSGQSSSGIAQHHKVDPFDLFCAYHLGIMADGSYRFQHIHQVAKRFNTNPGVIKQLLSDYGMDSADVINSDFDMAGAQVDVMLLPEGLDRVETARHLYAQFRSAPKKARNWNKELEQDARDNERVFGPGRRG